MERRGRCHLAGIGTGVGTLGGGEIVAVCETGSAALVRLTAVHTVDVIVRVVPVQTDFRYWLELAHEIHHRQVVAGRVELGTAAATAVEVSVVVVLIAGGVEVEVISIRVSFHFGLVVIVVSIVCGRLVDAVPVVAQIGARYETGAEKFAERSPKVLRPAGVDDRIHGTIDPTYLDETRRGDKKEMRLDLHFVARRR